MYRPPLARGIGVGTLASLLLITSTTSAQVAVGPTAPGSDTEAGISQPLALPVADAGTPHVPSMDADPGLRASPTSARDARLREGRDLDIPATALSAYRFAARTLAEADPACDLAWPVLAAIGKVESDHGRYAGAELRSDGVSVPSIRGVPLDGRGPVARVPDTDAGRLDGDARWDRAVGPMQFLPSTWLYAGVDADGDGVRSADDLDDAALGAAVYLCAGDRDLATRSGLRDAVRSYNPSDAYVEAVLTVAKVYAAGDFEEIWPEVPAFTARATALAAPPMTVPAPPAPVPARPSTKTAEHEPTKGRDQKSAEDAAPEADGPKKDPRPEPAPKPNEQEPTEEVPAPVEPTPKPGTSDTTDEPEPSEEPEPTEEPDENDGPELVVLTGPLLEVEGVWMIGETLLDVGDEILLAATAAHDLDGDGVLESNAEELSGLAVTADGSAPEHTVEVLAGSEPAVLWSIDDLAYRQE